MSSFRPASSLPRDLNTSTTSIPTNASSSGSGPTVVQPRPRPLIRGAAGTGKTILVNNCQRGNPVLTHIRNIGWEYADIVPDYQVGLSSCVLFLSIRYHRLHPEYVHTRIQKLQQMFTLRILLVMCDVNDHQAAIKELTKTALINNLSMMVAWSAEEAGRYIETYKSFEHKPPDLIKERVGEDYLSQVTNVLTQVRGVNRTDVVTLLSRFGSLKGVIRAGQEQVGMCPGFGEVKAKRLREVFSQPFRVGENRTYKQRKTNSGENKSTLVGNGDDADRRSGGAVMEVGAADAGRGVGLLEEDLLTTISNSAPDLSDLAQERTGSGESRNVERTNSSIWSNKKRALDSLEETMDELSEEEQLRLAMQLSMDST
ncbi:related to dna excision repair protein ercc-1 [Melanopsichium pennsylvanicum]|uniref:DNA excision repair protein ERCC-1 n=2 Tax=Melanopsichium pennsylvanicum TaxID=63383 RepID=A0AAJ4XST3_9BASI|nr:related to dna excision repair protein ercc-1 [Melanopsichium pennsylvanicum]